MEEPEVGSEAHRPRQRRMDEHPAEFLRDPLGGDGRHLRGHRLDRRARGRLDRQAEPRGEPDGAEESELVLGEPRRGVAYRAEDALAEVGATADEVDDAVVDRVEEHPVDREIPPRGVLLGRGEDDTLGPSAVEVDAVAPERGDLHVAPPRAARAPGPRRS